MTLDGPTFPREDPDVVDDEPERRPDPDAPDRPPEPAQREGIDDEAMRLPGEDSEAPDAMRTAGEP